MNFKLELLLFFTFFLQLLLLNTKVAYFYDLVSKKYFLLGTQFGKRAIYWPLQSWKFEEEERMKISYAYCEMNPTKS